MPLEGGYVREEQIAFLVLCDGKGWKTEAVQLYQVGSIPCTYIIDVAGMIIAKRSVQDEAGFRAALARAARNEK